MHITIQDWAGAQSILQTDHSYTAFLSIGKRTPQPIGWTSGHLLRLSCDDLKQPPYGPTLQDAQQIIDWTHSLQPGTSMLIHCTAGISRSTAAALIVQATDNPQWSAIKLFDWLLSIRPAAWPNYLLLSYGAVILDRPDLLVEYNNREQAMKHAFLERCSL